MVKIWKGFGSEHSSALVLIGKFKTLSDAKGAHKTLEDVIKKAESSGAQDLVYTQLENKQFAPDIMKFLQGKNILNLTPDELAELTFQPAIELRGKNITIRTEEIDVLSFVKILIEEGAFVQIFSTHNFSESEVTSFDFELE